MSGNAYAEASVPEQRRNTRLNVRCGNCGRLLAERVTAPWTIKCSRCKCVNESAPAESVEAEISEAAIKRVAAVRGGSGRQRNNVH